MKFSQDDEFNESYEDFVRNFGHLTKKVKVTLLEFVEEWNYHINHSPQQKEPCELIELEHCLSKSMYDTLGYMLTLDMDDFGRIINNVDELTTFSKKLD